MAAAASAGLVGRLFPCLGTGLSLAALAAEVCGVRLIISRASEESDDALAARLPDLAANTEFLRTVDGPPADVVLRAVNASGLNWIASPMSGDGRLELARWTREQSVTETMHRYGNHLGGN